MRFGTLFLFAAVCIAGCASNGEGSKVRVTVLSDYVPGVELSLVTIDVLDGAPSTPSRVLARAEKFVHAGDALATGLDVAVFNPIASGHYTLRAQAFSPKGNLLETRPLIVDITNDAIFTIDFSVDCASVLCDDGSGGGLPLACFGGRCVDARCSTSTPQYCTGITLCTADSECHARQACDSSHCESGLCVATPNAGACAADEYCSAQTGCTATTPAMPVGGTDSLCGTICPVSACAAGYYECDGSGPPVCANIFHRPAGVTCSGGACDGVGSCLPVSLTDAGTDGSSGDAGTPLRCAIMHGGCDPRVSCMDVEGGRICGACPSGFTGTGDTGCYDINECATHNGGCAGSVACTNTVGSFMCGSCPTGYTGDGTACTDINECMAHTDNCATGVVCTNTPGSFTCGPCPSGYRGDGTVCVDIDECHGLEHGGCAQVCTNTPGSFTCGCRDGFALATNGHSCNNLNVNSDLIVPSTPIGAAHGFAWDPGDVVIDNISLAAGVQGTLQCRTGKVAPDGTLSGDFIACPAMPFTPAIDLAATGDGLYATEVRVQFEGGATTTNSYVVPYYLHSSLVGAPDCADLGAPASADAAFAAAAAQHLQSRGAFDPSLTPADQGFVQLSNPFIRVNVAPPHNAFFQFGARMPHDSFLFPLRDGHMELLSLRHRFVLNADASMLMIYRRYASQRELASLSREVCSAAHFYPRHNGAHSTPACDAIVLNRDGAGVCLVAQSDGSFVASRGPGRPFEHLLAYLSMHIGGPDLMLEDGVDNAMWRQLSSQYSEGVQSLAADTRGTCALHCGAMGPGTGNCQGLCTQLGYSQKWGPKRFSSKCYGDPNCVEAMIAADHVRFPGPGFAPLYLPDAAFYRF